MQDPCRISYGPQGRRQKNFCIPPRPWFLEMAGYRWPLDPSRVVQTGRGSHAGHEVIWVEGLVNGRRRHRDFERVGLDAATHQPVEVGSEAIRTGAGQRVQPAKFVRFDYGAFTLEEYGHERPFWYVSGPSPGVALITSTALSLTHDGMLIVVNTTSPSLPTDKPTALALAEALRPIPAG